MFFHVIIHLLLKVHHITNYIMNQLPFSSDNMEYAYCLNSTVKFLKYQIPYADPQMLGKPHNQVFPSGHKTFH